MKYRNSFLLFFILLIMGRMVFSSPISDDIASHQQEDEIQALKGEILRLQLLLKSALQAMNAGDSEMITRLLRELEEITRKQEALPKENKPSDTGSDLNGLRRSIDNVKKELETLTGGIQFIGFFDVSASGYKNEPNVFKLGEFELDMEKSFGSNFQVAAALVFNQDGAQLAVGFIDCHLFGGPIATRGSVFTEKGLHFQVGRFDIPFGNDWLYYASMDRLTVSPPLSTNLVMDGGYNDVGLRLLRSAPHYNYTIYMLRGIEEGFSMGGRIGITPFHNLEHLEKHGTQPFEVGFSYMHDINRKGDQDERAMAVDLETRPGRFRLQSEWLHRDNYLERVHRTGYHISGFYKIGTIARQPLTLYSRFDYYKEKLFSTPQYWNISRFTTGLHVDIMDVLCLKAEYSHYLKEWEAYSGNSFYGQFVITF